MKTPEISSAYQNRNVDISVYNALLSGVSRYDSFA